MVTEQYPQGLGATVDEVAGHLGDVEPLPKTVFSGASADGFDLDGRDQVLICGIETHVCVYQTAAELLAAGVEVHVAEDAVSSRSALNREVGLRKMADARRGVHQRRDRPVRDARPRRHRRVQAGPGAGQVSAGYLLLEDGERFDGELVGALERGRGEVVFNTAMSGYQESVTDPSYRGQIIVFTYPMVGNYGVQAAHMESDDVHARAVIMREGVDRSDAPGPPAAG